MHSGLLQHLGPSPPTGPRNRTPSPQQLAQNPLLLSAPLSNFLSAFPCQIKDSQLQRLHCIHVLPPLLHFSPSPSLGPSPPMQSSNYISLSSSVRPFKQRAAEPSSPPNYLKTQLPRAGYSPVPMDRPLLLERMVLEFSTFSAGRTNSISVESHKESKGTPADSTQQRRRHKT